MHIGRSMDVIHRFCIGPRLGLPFVPVMHCACDGKRKANTSTMRHTCSHDWPCCQQRIRTVKMLCACDGKRKASQVFAVLVWSPLDKATSYDALLW